MKVCTKCKTNHHFDKFSCTKKDRDGNCKYYNSWCNECRTEQNRQRLGTIKKKKPKITEHGKQCLKCNIIKSFESFSKSSRGKLGLSSYCRNCAPRNDREKARTATSKYRKSHSSRWKTLHRLNMFRRRTNLQVLSDGTVTNDFIKFVYDYNICCWCKKHIEPCQRSLEHIVELNNGGKHSVYNITMACLSCNSKRFNKNNEHSVESLYKLYKETNT